jgi:hypothetical protein
MDSVPPGLRLPIAVGAALLVACLALAAVFGKPYEIGGQVDTEIAPSLPPWLTALIGLAFVAFIGVLLMASLKTIGGSLPR